MALSVYYLNLLSTQHCQFPHVPERLKQVVVQLSCCLQHLSIRLILLWVHLQQIHHTVHGFVLVQHLGPNREGKLEQSQNTRHNLFCFSERLI